MSNKKGFITLTVIFEAMSLNRDEGMGNIQTLHLLTRGNGKTYSYMSRQALTYAVRKFLIESGIWTPTPVFETGTGNNTVTQYFPCIQYFPEPDLFGYMVTLNKEPKNEKQGKSILRPAPVTFTHAVSLEPYNSDMAFYANIEMSRRSTSNPNPYSRQEHKSLYKYSVIFDLNRIGVEENVNEETDYIIIEINNIEKFKKDLGREGWREEESKNKKELILKKGNFIITLEQLDGKDNKNMYKLFSNNVSSEIKKNRVISIIDAIKNLSHQISAYREPLTPLFITAAHLKFGSPIFHNYVELQESDKSIINGELFNKGVEHTKTILKENGRLIFGIIKGAGDLHLDIDPKSDEIKDNLVEVIEEVKKWVNDVYNVKT